MRRIDYIIIHCSATPEGAELTPEALDALHRSRGFSGTGYHFYIRRDGTVLNTRPIAQIGAHAYGYNNHSIGICYEGGLDTHGNPADTRTLEQRTVLRTLVAQLRQKFPDARVCGHRDLPDVHKDCPCFDVRTEL